MSTELHSTTTDELVAVQFFGGRERGACLEVGNTARAFELRERLVAGETVEVEAGGLLCVGLVSGNRRRLTLEDFDALLEAGRVTFGEFGFTVALGSGDLFRFAADV